ncbi:MAG TPA: sulfurtransferase TusA family protein [Deltaproteobacteria bacterium]|nr:sulfurtransferase TusA family protein [Desulfobulbaceae bacterium]HIJ21121.1 sulfurtransferase TusA family protein [Deltaproteobacteria bacterium]HIJ41338.1 sulfurtransferase TusA family protein [Deltaproteobacteria bacterium]
MKKKSKREAGIRNPMMKTTEKPYQADKVLDLRGWVCPWVLLKAKSWLRRMNAGEILEVISSDAQINKSFSHAFERTGDRVISMNHDKDCYHVLVKRG